MSKKQGWGSTGKDLVERKETLPANISEEFYQELVEETKESIDAQLPTIKIAPGGVNLFQKDDDTLKKLDCIILSSAKANAMWVPTEEPMRSAFLTLFDDWEPEESDLPICSSFDGKISNHRVITTSVPGRHVFGHCLDCFFNEFKSDLRGGKGKACKNGRRLLILLSGSTIPNILMIPPTSIKAFDRYATSLLELKLALPIVYTTIELEKQTNEAGQPYSTAKFTMVEGLSDEDVLKSRELRKQYMELIKSQIQREEFEGSNGQTEAVDVEVEEESKDEDLPF